MNCSKCGNVLNPTDTFCPKCGQPVNVQNTETTNQTIGTPQPAPQQAPQPAMNNPYNQGQQPKKNTGFIIIIVILILAIIGVVLYFVLGNKDKTEDNNTGDTNTTVDNGTGDNNTQPTTVDNGGNTNTYTYKNYEFPVPTGYVAMEKECLYFIDQTNKVVAGVLSVFPYSYQNYVDYKEEIKTSGAEAGYDVKEVVEETHGNAKWLKIVAAGEGKEVIFYFTKLDQYSTVQYMYLNQGNTKSDEQIFTEFANVFANSKYKGTSGFSKDDSNGKKVDINKFNGDLSSMLD